MNLLDALECQLRDSTALKQSSWLRPKYLLFAAIGLMLAYVVSAR